jgi:hypothetical protein
MDVQVQVCCVVEASSLYAMCHMCPVCKTLANDGVPGLCTEHEFVQADLEMFLCNTCGAIMFLDLPRKPSLDDLERYRVSLEEADPALVRFLGNCPDETHPVLSPRKYRRTTLLGRDRRAEKYRR